MQAEQSLTNVAHHIVSLQKEVAQQRGELRTAERQQQIEAALASQTPKLLQWQSIQVRLTGTSLIIHAALAAFVSAQHAVLACAFPPQCM